MGQHTSKQRLRGAIQATHARRFCSGSTGEVTRGKLLEVYGVSADAPGDYFLWLAPRSPSTLAGADSGPTAWPDGNGEGRRKGGSSPLFSRGQVNPARNFKAGGISFVSSLSAAFPHPPGLLSLGAGAPRDGTPPFQACPRNLLPPPCPDPSQKPLLLQCSPLRLRFHYTERAPWAFEKTLRPHPQMLRFCRPRAGPGHRGFKKHHRGS